MVKVTDSSLVRFQSHNPFMDAGDAHWGQILLLPIPQQLTQAAV
jgi:hypothetical protein